MKTTQLYLASTVLVASVWGQGEQYIIDPSSVPDSTKQYWCQQQQSQCPLICLQTAGNTDSTQANDCDSDGLTYQCVCSNGVSPNITEYSQTLPYFICTEWGTQCVSNCGGNSQCATDCRQNHPCGATNPTRQNTSTLTHSMSATASSSGGSGGSVAVTTDSSGATIYSGFAGGAASSTGGSGGGDSSAASTLTRVWALSAGQTFGTLALVGGFIGGFAVLL